MSSPVLLVSVKVLLIWLSTKWFCGVAGYVSSVAEECIKCSGYADNSMVLIKGNNMLISLIQRVPARLV